MRTWVQPPEHVLKMPVLALCTCNPSSGRVETSESLGLWLARLGKLINSGSEGILFLHWEIVLWPPCSHTGDVNVNPHAHRNLLPLETQWHAIWHQSAYRKMRCEVWNLYFSWAQASIQASQSLQYWSLRESRPLLTDTCFVKAVR